MFSTAMTAPAHPWRIRLLVLSSVILHTLPVRADDANSRRTYDLLRDDENWAWLRTPSGEPDWWDPIKYIRLQDGRDDLFLSIGGEMRQWVEGYQNELWGSTGYVDNFYWLQRYMLHGDLRLTRYLRVFAQLKSGLEVGRRGGPRPIDEDRLDANQLCLDVDVVPAPTLDDDARLLLRIGRQEMSYGSGRLIDVREGPNVRVGYDGFRVIARPPLSRLDAFLVRPVLTKPGVFDDGPDRTQVFWGFWGTFHVPQLLVDAYYLGLDRDHGVYEQGMGHELRHTIGGRVLAPVAKARFVLELESAYQFGTFISAPISAWTVAGSAVIHGTGLPLSPQLTLGAGATSGDRNKADPSLNTFSPLFPRGAYFGLLGANGASNNVAGHAALALALPRSISISAEYWVFWRESLADGVYNVPGYLLRVGDGNPGRYLGTQLEGYLTWQVDRHLSLNGTVAYFWAGTFFAESPPGFNITYGALWATYKF
jgi:alginate export protein